MNGPMMFEKLRAVHQASNHWWREWWQRKAQAARAANGGSDPTPEEVQAAEPETGGYIEFHPLFDYDCFKQLMDADNLFWQSGKDFEMHVAYTDSEIAKAKKLAAVQMQADSLDKAIDALGRWRQRLEARRVE